MSEPLNPIYLMNKIQEIFCNTQPIESPFETSYSAEEYINMLEPVTWKEDGDDVNMTEESGANLTGSSEDSHSDDIYIPTKEDDDEEDSENSSNEEFDPNNKKRKRTTKTKVAVKEPRKQDVKVIARISSVRRVVNGKYQCPIPGCNYTANKKATLAAHKTRSHKNKTYACPHCDKVYRLSDSRLKHVQRHHSKESTEKKVTKKAKVRKEKPEIPNPTKMDVPAITTLDLRKSLDRSIKTVEFNSSNLPENAQLKSNTTVHNLRISDTLMKNENEIETEIETFFKS